MLALALIPAPNLGGMSVLGNPWLDLALLVAAGLLAGVINAMAGGGSFLTIPLLVALGLPAGIANGTNRVAVLAQNATLVATFHRNGVRDHALTLKLLVPMLLGAGLGAWLATQLDDAVFRPVIGALLVFWAVVLLVKPDRFLHPPDEQREPTVMTYLLAGVIAIYGGFLQAGVGFPLIALLTGHLGYDLVRANSVKASVVLATTLVALPMFMIYGQVVWTPALVLAAGTMFGAWVGARWQLDKGAAVVRWVVMIMVAISGVLMLRSAF